MVDLPRVPDRIPQVSPPRERALPEPRVYRPQLETPQVAQQRVEALHVAETTSPWREIGAALDNVAGEANEVAKIMAREAGLKSVTRDADGNVAVEKYPIVGDAALSFKKAMEVAAVTDGESVAKRDLMDMRTRFQDDPDGFRSAAGAYRQEKVAQYEKVAGPGAGLSLGAMIDNTAVETYRGLLNRQETLELKRATASIETQITSTENELFALANGGDTESPEFRARVQKVAALYEQLGSNPRLGISRDEIDYKLRKLDSELKVAQLDYHLKTIQEERGPAAAMLEAEKVRTDPRLNLTPGERVNYYSRLVGGIQQRINAQNRVDKGIEDEIKSARDSATQGFTIPPERMATLATQVQESKNPALVKAFQDVRTVQPIIADWRKASPAQLEANLAQVDQTMREHGASSDLMMLRESGDKLLKNMRDHLKVDPLGWADRTGAVPVPPINFSAPDVVGQLRDRASRAEIVANTYGIQPSYFKPEESAALTAAAAKGGDAMIGTANMIVQGFGERAPRALSEISKDSPVLAHLGSLMRDNGSPAFIRDAAQAVELRANPDYKHPRWATSGSEGVAISTAQNNHANDVYGAAFALAPEARRAAEATAQSAFFTRSARQGYDPKLEALQWNSKEAYDKALQEAAGATYLPDKTQVGGIATYKPGANYWDTVKVLIPSNMVADRFTSVMDAIRDEDVVGAVDNRGNAYKARDLRNATPVATANGYQFALGDPYSDDPKWIRGVGGRPYVLNLQALEPTLRKRVPGAYVGGQ